MKMRVTALSAVVLCLLIGYSHSATIFREGREGDQRTDDIASPVLENQKPSKEILSELRQEAVVEAVEAVAEQKVVEAAEQVEQEVAPLQILRISEPVIVLAQKEVISEVKEDPLVAIVEPEIALRNTEIEPEVAVRNTQVVGEIASDLKNTPVQAVEEVAVPAAAVIVQEHVGEEIVAEEVASLITLKAVPVVKGAVVSEATSENGQAIEEVPVVADEAAPVVKNIPLEEEKPVAVIQTEPNAIVQPVEGSLRQNVVAEGEAPRPTFFQQAQQVLTNNPITQFIANNPLTNAIRGGTTPAPGSAPENDAAPASSTARPGLFAQLFNPSTTAAAAANTSASTTVAPGFIQTAFSNIQNALPQPPNILANFFSGNRETTTTPAAAAPEAERKPVLEDEASSNAIQQAKKKRIAIEQLNVENTE